MIKRTHRLCCLLALLPISGLLCAAETAPLCFDTSDLGDPADTIPEIEPWRVITLEPDYAGLWVVASELDGDGQVEIVSAENCNVGDVHYTSAAVAQKLDGTVLWRWGDPDAGRKKLHHDVACQIHDWDGDGKNEVVVCTKGSLVELDGATGEERRRLPIPEEATDCLVFCNLSGGERPTDVLVKTRYGQIWAYDHAGKLLWTVDNPGGYRTAHQPRPIDLDGDGRDEVMAGYALLNPDGSVRWVFKSAKVDLARGHLDCCRVVRRGATPQDFRLVLTCCGANNVALVDGAGQTLWEVSGHHFESANVGRIVPDRPGLQILVDIDHQPRGQSPLWLLDEKGNHLGQIVTDYSRQHRLLDWTGDGIDEILVAYSRGIYNHQGERIATFAMNGPASTLLIGDMTGDGVPDAALVTSQAVCIYRNESGQKPGPPVPLGSGPNVTLY